MDMPTLKDNCLIGTKHYVQSIFLSGKFKYGILPLDIYHGPIHEVVVVLNAAGKAPRCELFVGCPEQKHIIDMKVLLTLLLAHHSHVLKEVY
jgi:hypothetical protein